VEIEERGGDCRIPGFGTEGRGREARGRTEKRGGTGGKLFLFLVLVQSPVVDGGQEPGPSLVNRSSQSHDFFWARCHHPGSRIIHRRSPYRGMGRVRALSTIWIIYGSSSSGDLAGIASQLAAGSSHSFDLALRQCTSASCQDCFRKIQRRRIHSACSSSMPIGSTTM
jgi:hypothetical protein